jgi:Lrp/AsnC family leucine-responsive transcriptional regulator
MSHIDSIDERILGELQANGRLTMKALAERIGLSSPAMIERVRRLEDRGIITGYRAVVAPDSLGRPIDVVIMIRLTAFTEHAFDQVIQRHPSIAEMHRLTGRWTHFLRAHVANTTELEALLDALRVAGAICESSIVTSSPLTWRETTPPALAEDRSRPARRGRPAASELDEPEESAAQAPRRGPGRPRTRRPGQ